MVHTRVIARTLKGAVAWDFEITVKKIYSVTLSSDAFHNAFSLMIFTMTHRMQRHLLVILLILGCVAGARSGLVDSLYFTYDEADYVSALEQGFWANYRDTTSPPFLAFLYLGGEDYVNQERQRLATFVRESQDVAFYRHYHPPLLWYGAMVWSHFFGHSEISIRWYMVACSLLLLGLFYGILVTLSSTTGLLPAILTAIFASSSGVLLHSSLSFSPHVLYTLFALSALWCFSRYLQSGILRYWYGTCALLSFSLVSMELGIFPVLAVIISMLLAPTPVFTLRSGAIEISHHFWYGLGGGAALTFLLYPGGVTQFTWFRTGLWYGSLLVRDRADAYGTHSLAELGNFLLGINFLEFAVAAGGLAYLIRQCRIPAFRHLLPFVIFGALTSTAVLWLAAYRPAFLLAPMFTGFLGLGVFLQHRRAGGRWMALSAGGIVASYFLTLHGYTHSPPRDPAIHRLLVTLEAEWKPGEALFVSREFLPTVRYYLIDSQPDTRRGSDSAEPLLLKIQNQGYHLVVLHETSELASARILQTLQRQGYDRIYFSVASHAPEERWSAWRRSGTMEHRIQ